MVPCIFFAVSGLLLGSFLNVCIVRLPRGESVVTPRSHCPRCQQLISNRDNVPVLSWLILRGRCRHCGGPISWRYPVVEVATCLLFLLCCLYFPVPVVAGGWALLCFLLLGLAVMDAQTFLLPDLFTLPGIVAGLLFAAVRSGFKSGMWSWSSSLRAAGLSLVAALIASATLLLIAGTYWLLRRRMGMGMGDVKLLAMIGAWLGLELTALTLFLAVIAGAVYGLGAILLHRERSDQPAGLLEVPFGTMLSGAGLYSIFLGQRTLDWYLHFFH